MVRSTRKEECELERYDPKQRLDTLRRFGHNWLLADPESEGRRVASSRGFGLRRKRVTRGVESWAKGGPNLRDQTLYLTWYAGVLGSRPRGYGESGVVRYLVLWSYLCQLIVLDLIGG